MHGGIDSAAFGVLLQLLVASVDVRQVQASAEHGGHIALVACGLAGLVHIALHAGVPREVQVHVLLCGAAVDAELLRQAKRAHAVDEPEVDGLRGAALVGGHGFWSHAEHFGRRGLVHVTVCRECSQQAFIAGQMRHDAQFNLRIVRCHQ